MILGVLLTAIIYKYHGIEIWEELQYISMFFMFLIVFVLYIIIMRKLIIIMRNKYPEFY